MVTGDALATGVFVAKAVGIVGLNARSMIRDSSSATEDLAPDAATHAEALALALADEEKSPPGRVLILSVRRTARDSNKFCFVWENEEGEVEYRYETSSHQEVEIDIGSMGAGAKSAGAKSAGVMSAGGARDAAGADGIIASILRSRVAVIDNENENDNNNDADTDSAGRHLQSLAAMSAKELAELGEHDLVATGTGLSFLALSSFVMTCRDLL